MNNKQKLEKLHEELKNMVETARVYRQKIDDLSTRASHLDVAIKQQEEKILEVQKLMEAELMKVLG